MIKEELWSSFYPECHFLFEQHNAEIGEDVLSVDEESHREMNRIGVLQIVSYRKDGILKGYCLFTISRNLYSKDILCGTQGLWFVAKDARNSSAGIRMYIESIRLLKIKGVTKIYPHLWEKSPKGLRKFFKRLGAKPLQQEYSLEI